MGKVKGKHRLDKYYHLAKEHGYRSRAAWKLVQLDSKFSFLRSSRGVLDLCAAPGGWMQVCVERVPVGSLVIGVDLDPIRPVRGAIAIQEDITQTKCKSTVKRIMAENGVRALDLVLHDGSPNVGGAWAKEATSQNALVIDSVKLAAELLAPKGTFVTKVFRSQDYSAVLYCLRQLFEKVEVDKPLASRSASAEIYIIGLKYKAPAKIDPRLLDFKHLFQGGVVAPKVLDVLGSTKQKRHRDGYEDGLSTMHKVCPAAEFVWSDTPLDILGSVTSINFGDSASLPIKDHSSTTEEVKALCDDLRVLGKQDFKYLLKWRMQIRKALSSSEQPDLPTSDVAEESKGDEDESKGDEDEKLLNEMEDLSHAIDRKKKREKKLVAKRRAKDKARKATGMQVDATIDGYGDDDLFALASIKGKGDLVAVDNNEFDDEADAAHNSDSEEEENNKGDLFSDADSEEERRRYDEHMEELLDEAYDRYLSRTEGSTRQKKRTKQAHLKEDLNEEIIPSGHDSDNDRVDEKNPLVVPLEDVQTQEQIKAQWFSQDVFAETDEHDDMDKYESEDEMQVDVSAEQFATLSKKQKGAKKKANVSGQGVQASKTQDEDFETKKKANVSGQGVQASKTQDEDFEIVPAPNSDSSDSSSDESDIDDVETKAEILAYAKKMLRKKQREEILDDSYNKYLFHDTGLPNWFVDDEKKHHVPMKPITKEEVNAMKAQFKDIDARPVKKVAEAKARKKRVAYRKLEKVRKKANTISDQADISDRSKSKMIESLYSKATKENRPKKEYVVAKKGVKVKVAKGQVLVDPRMKKDTARSQGKSKQGKGKGKPKGKGGPTKSPAKGKPTTSPAKGKPRNSPAMGKRGGNRRK